MCIYHVEERKKQIWYIVEISIEGTHICLLKIIQRDVKIDYLKSISAELKCIESWSDQIWFISTLKNPESDLNSHVWCVIRILKS